MRTVIQRVSHASVSIGCHCKSAIQGGLLILLGIEEADNEEDIETGGDILVISQFTLMASYKKGNRPSYIRAAGHATAIPLYESFCRKLGEALGKPVQTGEFGAEMKVDLLNHGPVTICMDTKNKE